MGGVGKSAMPRAPSPGRFKLVTLRKAREIQRPDAEGARLISRHIVICYAPGLTEIPRVAIKASRRLGGAVVRNKMRRRIKEICRRLFPQLKEPLDVLVIPRAAALEIDYGTLENDFWRLFRQRGLLKRGKGHDHRPGEGKTHPVEGPHEGPD